MFERFEHEPPGPRKTKRSLDDTDRVNGDEQTAGAAASEDVQAADEAARPAKKSKRTKRSVKFADPVALEDLSKTLAAGSSSTPKPKATPRSKQDGSSSQPRSTVGRKYSPYFERRKKSKKSTDAPPTPESSPLTTRTSKGSGGSFSDQLDDYTTPSSTFPGTFDLADLKKLALRFDVTGERPSNDGPNDKTATQPSQQESSHEKASESPERPQQESGDNDIDNDEPLSTQAYVNEFLSTQWLRADTEKKQTAAPASPAPSDKTSAAQRAQTTQLSAEPSQSQTPAGSAAFNCTWSWFALTSRLDPSAATRLPQIPAKPPEPQSTQGPIIGTFDDHCTWSWIDRPSQIQATYQTRRDSGQTFAGNCDGKYYSVRKGRDPGVYKNCSDAIKQVVRLNHVQCEIFDNEEEANGFAFHEDDPKCRWGWCCPKTIEESDEQEAVKREVVDNGRNVCYLGAGGTGKSYVLKKFVKLLREAGKRVHVIAPSALAALGVNGTTLDSYAGWSPETKKKHMEQVMMDAMQGPKAIRMLYTDVLVIDEISMVSSITFDRLSNVCQVARGNLEEPFGGMQVVVTGDFRQLGPVKPFDTCGACGTETDKDKNYKCPKCPNKVWGKAQPLAFGAPAWDKCNFTYLALTKPFRQGTDLILFNLLTKLRFGPLSKEDAELLLNHVNDTEGGLHIFAKNQDADDRNARKLDELPGDITTFPSFDGTQWNDTPSAEQEFEARKKHSQHRLSLSLPLKLGMPVMLTTNINNSLVNGLQGTLIGYQPAEKLKTAPGDFYEYRKTQLEGWDEEHGEECPEFPLIRLEDGSEHLIHPICLLESIGELPSDTLPSLVSRTQIPLQPAWAVSIHKSQSQTLDKVIVHTDDIWDRKQAYTALSRAKTLKGMRVVSRNGLKELMEGSEVMKADRELDEWLARKFPGKGI